MSGLSETPAPICSAWITGDDVEGCGPTLVSNPALLDDAAYDASWLLYEASGRAYPGICERTVRPCRQTCACGFLTSALWYWTYASYGGWGWRDDCGNKCGCGTLSQVRLSGWVREIVEVKIDGEIVDPDSYRLDNHENLTRMADPGPPARSRFWPNCQRLDLNDDQPGTFAVTYRWGADVPMLGRLAAAQLARELWKACAGDTTCVFNPKVTKVVRQGVTTERVTRLAADWRKGSTGIPLVDLFLAGANPNGAQQEAMVWSPDVQQYAREVG